MSISQLQYHKSNLFYWLLLLFSGDITTNPGPCITFRKQTRTNGIFPNVEKYISSPQYKDFLHIAELTNVAVIEIFESKFDHSMFSSEIQSNEYDLLVLTNTAMEKGSLL